MDCFGYVTVLGELEAKGDSGLFLASLRTHINSWVIVVWLAWLRMEYLTRTHQKPALTVGPIWLLIYSNLFPHSCRKNLDKIWVKCRDMSISPFSVPDFLLSSKYFQPSMPQSCLLLGKLAAAVLIYSSKAPSNLCIKACWLCHKWLCLLCLSDCGLLCAILSVRRKIHVLHITSIVLMKQDCWNFKTSGLHTSVFLFPPDLFKKIQTFHFLLG